MHGWCLPQIAGLVFMAAAMIAQPARSDGLKDDIAPAGKLRVAIAISPAASGSSQASAASRMPSACSTTVKCCQRFLSRA